MGERVSQGFCAVQNGAQEIGAEVKAPTEHITLIDSCPEGPEVSLRTRQAVEALFSKVLCQLPRRGCLAGPE
jgi:hypothetical protein